MTKYIIRKAFKYIFKEMMNQTDEKMNYKEAYLISIKHYFQEKDDEF